MIDEGSFRGKESAMVVDAIVVRAAVKFEFVTDGDVEEVL